jgi:hypothetical protein
VTEVNQGAAAEEFWQALENPAAWHSTKETGFQQRRARVDPGVTLPTGKVFSLLAGRVLRKALGEPEGESDA